MFLLGDVLAILALIIGTSVSAWALIIACAVIFRRRSEVTQSVIERNPWRCLGTGLVATMFLVIVGSALLAQPVPLLKLVGWLMLLVQLSISTVGLAGLALFVADRIQTHDSSVKPFMALSRATLILLVATLVPFLGLFVLVPILLAVGAGATLNSFFVRRELAAPPFIESQL